MTAAEVMQGFLHGAYVATTADTTRLRAITEESRGSTATAWSRSEDYLRFAARTVNTKGR